MVGKASLIAPDRAAALAALRAEMQAAGNVAAYIVPSEDPHMSEYSPDCCARRMYISGFTGSAGTVVVTMDAALLWTDGRYYLQAEQQLSDGWTLMKADQPGVPSPSQWLATTLSPGAKVAIDPYVHTINSARSLQTEIAAAEQEIAMTHNLVDKCALTWTMELAVVVRALQMKLYPCVQMLMLQ
jgi:Xaa-Pro aminopeptidase